MAPILAPLAPKDPIAEKIDAAIAAQGQQLRPHFGLSLAGHHCERYLWLNFRWAVQEKFDGRMLRLFKRGQDEEARFADSLRVAGITITRDQERVDFGCHVSGSIDGVAQGLPQSVKPHLAEMKTHSKKSFDDLNNKGVQVSKPMHYAQMQTYMLGLKLDRALYCAVCKDDDRLYFERVRLDKAFAQGVVDRAKRVALADNAPDPISTRPDWYQCKFCPAYAMCHEKAPTKHVNCRTCAHSTAKDDGTWRCERHEADDIPFDFQQQGCDDHVLHPDMVPWQLDVEKSTKTTAVYIVEGNPIENGSPNTYTFASSELVADSIGCSLGRHEIARVKEAFVGARVVARA